ncbi:MAG: MarR family transcriptional regulator [Chloroflexi bacterium]|nr:MarR family transcriptional regulator [Chloroflexota bacterium]MBM3172927.1 MarR family transcriptional regulator [Chloroflexota bacterium]MBM3174532.1 MarR family transcriptional regulator [Chloroflexota bacterium]MBM4449409.1 MarR family transcriptional regulator [Chloroflexota bacterium]
MNPVQREAEYKRLIEDFGIVFDEMGLPRMAGRILGWLLVCDPPHQSAAQLREMVGGSKGAISTMTWLLIHSGLVERLGMPGSRATYYRFKCGSWSELMKSRMSRVRAMRELSERGLSLMESESPEMRRRLEEMRDFYLFFEQKVLPLLDRREQHHVEKLASTAKG